MSGSRSWRPRLSSASSGGSVTKWALDGVTLRIETGLFRRDARQLPVARIQAVDVVRPFLARVFGLAELRIRLAGGGKSGGRLTYLSEAEAVDLRARLMAGHHGLDMATPEPAERPLATVATGRLVASAILQPGDPGGGRICRRATRASSPFLRSRRTARRPERA